MRTGTPTLLLALLCLGFPAYGKCAPVRVTIVDPFIEMHTGPGRGYPIFYVADRGSQVDVLVRRTDWFQVRNDRGVEGWVPRDQLSRTLDESGRAMDVSEPAWDDFERSRRELSLQIGAFGGANSIALNLDYRFSANIAGEVSFSHITGNFSNGWMGNVRIIHYPFPEWRIAPFLMLGTGVIQISPKATLVNSSDRTDTVGQAGVGVRAYVTRRFLVRAEYSGYVVFNKHDANQKVEEWKAGFAFFF
jgi:SH3-like domain-containing protein